MTHFSFVSIFASLSQGMQNSEDFLTLSPTGNNAKRLRLSLSPPINPPQKMQTQVTPISPLMAPYTPSNHNTDSAGNMNVDAPVTALSLSNIPILKPHTEFNHNTDNAGDVRLNAPVTALSLSTSSILSPKSASNQKKYEGCAVHVNVPVPVLSRARRARSLQGKSETITPPYLWATNRRATVHSYKYLLQNKITTITGRVKCKRCDERFEMKLDLESKLGELWKFILQKKDSMHDRAPKVWVEPVLPKCEYCGRENSVEPILANTKKKTINWLFLLLAQMLGCCTIKQLKYFCKHTKNHRTGAKDRLVYSVCMGLCKQLLPELFCP